MDQATQILQYMQRGRSIDPQQALRLFSTMRLAARILDLKRAGHQISKEICKSREGRKFARYSLV